MAATAAPSHPRAAATKRSAAASAAAALASSSPDSSPLRPAPLNRLAMNDDTAEKATRRKSAHFADLGVAGGNGKENAAGAGAAGQPRKPSALAVQRKGKRLSAVAPNAAPVVSMEVMNTNFEEWMKLATDNKITATNTWNFALIDYFHDLTLLRNGPDDQSINFQKASCTLDGCVKIWTSRVDSVATETGKLLSGLAGGSGEDGDGEGADGDEDESGEPKATRKSHRSEATLAKSFDALKVKKFDLEFTVDPLFKKTCADFDEGGAMGLLMNHLAVDGRGRVVFDAGDAGLDEEEDSGELEEELIDIAKLREFIPTVDRVADLSISETLSSFRFSSNPGDIPDFSTIAALNPSLSDDSTLRASSYRVGEAEPAPIGTGEEVDFFGGEDFDMGGGGGFDDGASAAGDMDDGDVFGAPANPLGGSLGMALPGEGHTAFDPRRAPGQELVVALTGGEDDEGMFDYFDKGFGRAWAGAEHWKLRKVSRKPDAAVAATTKTARAAKAPFTIDFNSPDAAQSPKALFAPAPKSTITLPSSSRASSSKKTARRSKADKTDAARRKDEWLLPDDMHFSSRQLLRLFLKPKFSLRVRRNAHAAQMAAIANGEIDENFWAQAAADRIEPGADGMDSESAPIPFESQFFHDDDGASMADYADVDDGLDALTVNGDADPAGAAGDEDDLWKGTQGQELRRVRPENVHFAKKAKRVDVKRLKDDIWTGLKVLVPDSESEAEAEAPKTPEDVKTFDTVIQDLRGAYPREKMSEISTSFCFICLLHLANEEGLRIETARFDGLDEADAGMKGFARLGDDGTVEDRVALDAAAAEGGLDRGEKRDRIVGELQALKVYKDPNAGRAA